MDDPNSRQVGGTHYESDYQHWDWVYQVKLGYHAACASKYIARHRKKNGEEDLLKAQHYVQKCAALDVKPRKKLKGRNKLTERFVAENDLNASERAALLNILAADWEGVQQNITYMLIAVRGERALLP